MKELKQFIEQVLFTKSAHTNDVSLYCRRYSDVQPQLVVIINTHASPIHGGLLYGSRKSTGLDVVCV